MFFIMVGGIINTELGSAKVIILGCKGERFAYGDTFFVVNSRNHPLIYHFTKLLFRFKR